MRTLSPNIVPNIAPNVSARHRGKAALGAALLFLGLAAAVAAQTTAPVAHAPYSGQPDVTGVPTEYAPTFGQMLDTTGGKWVNLNDGAFQQALAGTAWAVKFVVQASAKGDYVTRTGAGGPQAGQVLFGANRTSGTARVVLSPSGAAPLVIDGGAGASLTDGKPHWLEVDCSGGNYYAYTDGVLSGSATGAAAWAGAGAACTPKAGTTDGTPATNVDAKIDELAVYSAALHTGAAPFTPDGFPIANYAAHQVALYHFDSSLADSNTNTAP